MIFGVAPALGTQRTNTYKTEKTKISITSNDWAMSLSTSRIGQKTEKETTGENGKLHCGISYLIEETAYIDFHIVRIETFLI